MQTFSKMCKVNGTLVKKAYNVIMHYANQLGNLYAICDLQKELLSLFFKTSRNN